MHIHFDSDQLLHQHQLRKTPVRKEVLDVFLSRSEAVSQQYIEQHFDAIDRVTLYRTLKTFEQKGIIHVRMAATSTLTLTSTHIFIVTIVVKLSAWSRYKHQKY